MHIPTDEEMERQRRSMVISCAIIALRVAAPEGLSCARLAEVLGISANGLDGFLAGEPRIIKEHRREKGATRFTTFYRLAQLPATSDQPAVVQPTAKA